MDDRHDRLERLENRLNDTKRLVQQLHEYRIEQLAMKSTRDRSDNLVDRRLTQLERSVTVLDKRVEVLAVKVGGFATAGALVGGAVVHLIFRLIQP